MYKENNCLIDSGQKNCAPKGLKENVWQNWKKGFAKNWPKIFTKKEQLNQMLPFR